MSGLNISRFANPLRTKEVSIGACGCPGTPHDLDGGTARVVLGGSALARVGQAALERVTESDPLRAKRRLILESLVSWNLLGPDGEPWAINEATVELLDEPSVTAFAKAIDEINENKPLPKRSSARSGSGTPASASRRRKRTRTSTRR